MSPGLAATLEGLTGFARSVARGKTSQAVMATRAYIGIRPSHWRGGSRRERYSFDRDEGQHEIPIQGYTHCLKFSVTLSGGLGYERGKDDLELFLAGEPDRLDLTINGQRLAIPLGDLQRGLRDLDEMAATTPPDSLIEGTARTDSLIARIWLEHIDWREGPDKLESCTLQGYLLLKPAEGEP